MSLFQVDLLAWLEPVILVLQDIIIMFQAPCQVFCRLATLPEKLLWTPNSTRDTDVVDSQ